jgi:capsular exopolysaccharide synthesis family protein
VAEVPNLVIMPCGPRPENPSELLSSGQFANVVDMLRERFDFVIIDTPPLLAVTDAMAIAAQVDGVILTFRIDKRSRPIAVRARDMLLEMGAQTIGVVVNGISGEHKGYGGYRYTYGGGYGYGYGSDKDTRGIRSYFDDDLAPHSRNGNGKPKPVADATV